MIDVIILAGGLGTRLSDTIGPVPKGMAIVAGKPFLDYLLTYLRNSGISNVILSVGHYNEQIISFLGDRFNGISIRYSIESEPLGTGGAVKEALKYGLNDRVLIMNGDTLFAIDLKSMILLHEESNSDATIALCHVNNSSRYGSVVLDESNRIIDFKEKDCKKSTGIINGGIYLFNRRLLDEIPLTGKFSLEHDYLKSALQKHHFQGFVVEDYFRDIGIPDDYAKAQIEFPSIKIINGIA